MRILFTTDQIYLHGGIEKVMAEKANWFAENSGHEVFILTTEQKGLPPCYPLSSKINVIDIGVNYLRYKSYFHYQNIIKIPKHFRRWKKTIRKINPDVLISCNYAFDFYWIPFCMKSIPKLKEYHSSRYFEHQAKSTYGLKKKWLSMFNEYIESKFTKLILLNSDEVPFYKSKNTVVISNPIQRKTEKSAVLDNKKAIAAGRIVAIKGFDVMISVWENVVKKCADWELHIYGQGEEFYIYQLNTQIKKAQLENNVFIHPATDRLDLAMLDSSLYLMTSKTECYPMVLIEALTLGLPVLTFDCPTGPRHIVKNGVTGLLTPDQDIDAMAIKVIELIQNESFRKQLGRNAYREAIWFQQEHVMKSWEELLTTIQ